MNGVSREEVANLIHAAKLEWKNEHSLEGCEAVRTLSTYVHGDLNSEIEKGKNTSKAFIEAEKRLSDLDKKDTGKVTILWEDKIIMKKAFNWLVGSFITAILTFIGGLSIFWITQNGHLVRTEEKIDNTNRYQIIQTLYAKYSATGDIATKNEAEALLKKISIK
jgi:hypothetical protein